MRASNRSSRRRFKTPDVKKALEGRAKPVEFVQNRGWLLAEDSLKTKLIVERYGETTVYLQHYRAKSL